MEKPKDKIIKEAFKLFLTKSYNSVSMKDIQDAAKSSRGAIYHHFRSKEEIYEAAVNKYLLPTFVNFSLIPDENRKSLQDAIYAVIKVRQSHVNFLNETTSFKLLDFYFFKFIFEATEHCKGFREQISSIVEKEFNGWRNLIQQAMRTGEIRADIDLDYTAKWFITAPLDSGITSAFSMFITVNLSDIRSTYLRYYNLIKKNNSFM